ncbi:flavodoxin family protein [Clostridium felsineum]|uniref:flavodoxin family protein n=1 Tax=Clostridium felsineum TaxID=36839 RepID=UPI00098CBBAE|nr:NAD(P)H-dependent oxidoreductase [Clostridium felsineum]URZ16647.1 hypothetical protein CLFE_026940 [Clostridium felsineum DSM 794]
MSKILFMNTSPNENGNTFRMGTDYLRGLNYDTLQMTDYKIYQYGQVYEDDQINEMFAPITAADTLVIGSPVYWYSVGGMLKTFFDRLYMLPEAETLRGKKLYFFAQGGAPSKEAVDTIKYLITGVCRVTGMKLRGFAVGALELNKMVKPE